MPKTDTLIFMTSKSSNVTPISNINGDISSKIPGKTSSLSNTHQPWLKIVFGLIAAAGIAGTVGISVVSFVILRPTTTTTTTTTSTTSTSTTTGIMCYTPPSSRPSNVWLSVDNMAIQRAYHTATFIPEDSSVLIAGGHNGLVYHSSVEKYIPSTGCFQPMRDMPRSRYMHSADQLASLSGYVVIAGGVSSTSGVITVADLYHPITGDILTISLSSPRYLHIATVMSSSQIVLTGGYITGLSVLASSDMIDTTSNSLFVAGTNIMNEAHIYHTATSLGNNSDLVLVAGGLTGATAISTAYLYHGSSNAFIALGTGVVLSPARYQHAATYLPAPINKVLFTGGVIPGQVSGVMTLFDVATLTFIPLTTTLIYPRYFHTATLLPNGKILVIGGYHVSFIDHCELIDPSNNYSVTLAADLITGRYLHTATLIPDNNNGTVLVCGGYNPANVAINSCELYYV